MDIYNLTYNELQNRITHERKKHLPNDLSHPTFMHIERVIITNTRRNPQTISIANLAFTGASKENIDFLMVEDKKMEKDLEFVRKQIEWLQEGNQNLSSRYAYLWDLWEAIYGDIWPLGDIMRHIYEELVTLNKVVVP